MRTTPDTREEAAAKLPALHMLMVMGWDYLIPADALASRGSLRSVVLLDVLKDRLQQYRFMFKGQCYPLSDNGIAQVLRIIGSPDLSGTLLDANKAIYTHLTHGITVTESVDGQRHAVTVPLIDWHDVGNNRFQVTEELSVSRVHQEQTYRPDIVCYVNGLPLVVIEAKKPASTKPKAMVEYGIEQHKRNQAGDGIQDLYAYSQLLMSITGTEGQYGTTNTAKEFWSIWKEEEISRDTVRDLKNTKLSDAQTAALFGDKPHWARAEFQTRHDGPLLETEQDWLLVSLLRQDRLLEFIRHYLFFDHKKGKIAARYQQAFGTKSLIKQIAKKRPDGGREGGVIWHTTGSGKSNLMVFLTKGLLLDPELADCRIIVVTDRIDLENQLSATFISGGAFGSAVATKKDGDKAKTQSGKDLAVRISSGTERIIFTTLQRFGSATKQKTCHNDTDKLIVLIDEGHRSQSGENHERMRQALPNAAYIAFTGTPLLKDDKTRNKFGPILHAYTMQMAVEDGAVTPLIYEERRPQISIDETAVDMWFEKRTKDLSEKQKADLKQKYATRGEIYKAERRVELIAADIADHFVQNFAPDGMKGQLATDSKQSAVRYKKYLDATGLVSSAIIISAPDTREDHEDQSSTSDPEVLAWWKANMEHDPAAYEKKTITDFGTDGAPDILIVVDKLLTGFDEPRNAVLYIDKQLKGHNLLQAIARVNRLHEGKQFGYLIDYRGILGELDTSIADYQDLAEQTQAGYDVDDLAGTVSNISTVYKRLPALHDALWAIFGSVQNTGDREQFRRTLVPVYEEDETGTSIDIRQKVREDFYDALTSFGMCLKHALSTRSLFEDTSFTEAMIRTYKEHLKFFTDLRIEAKRDAQETIDFSAYEAQIRNLVDRQVIGQGIVEPEGVILVDQLGSDGSPEDWSEEKTRNEADVIKTRIRKTIESDLIDDPHAQRVFSELLKDAIREAEALFDHPDKQYTMFKDLEEQVRSGTASDIPDALSDNRQASVYYGLMLETLDQAVRDQITEVGLIDEAKFIDRAVLEAIQTHSVNPANIDKEIRKALLVRLFKLLGNTGGTDLVNTLIDQIITVVRAGRGRSQS